MICNIELTKHRTNITEKSFFMLETPNSQGQKHWNILIVITGNREETRGNGRPRKKMSGSMTRWIKTEMVCVVLWATGY